MPHGMCVRELTQMMEVRLLRRPFIPFIKSSIVMLIDLSFHWGSFDLVIADD